MSQYENDAVLYMRTSKETYTPKEVAQLAALKTFADAAGWTLTEAAVEPESAAEHPLWDRLSRDFRDRKVGAIIIWDEEAGYPGVWEDDLPTI